MKTIMHLFPRTLLVLAVALIFVQCKKDEETPPPPPPEVIEPAITNLSDLINIPDGLKNSTDPNAMLTNIYIQLLSSFDSYMAYFDLANDAELDQDNTYTWTSGVQGFTVTQRWSYDGSGSENIWKLQYSINGSPFYDYATSTQNDDGTSGSFRYDYSWVCSLDNDAECDEVIWNYTWNTDSEGVVTMDYEISSNGTVESRYVITSSPDGSGTMTLFEEGTKVYESMWNSDGSGSFTDFENDESGTWSAGS